MEDMVRNRHSFVHVLIGAFFLMLPGMGMATVPTEQGALEDWWDGAGRLWLGDTGYIAAGHVLDDGLCKASFDEGILIPVYSGEPPVSERIVGLVFMGSGELEVGFATRADAWRFANHRVMKMGESESRWAPVANQESPYQVSFDRTLILSGDPEIRSLVEDLDPIGAGVILRDGDDGVDEEYVITEDRGGLTARVVGTNLLPNRRRQLQKAGIEIQAMLRQDRMLTEELGVPGEHLRVLADFRTSDRHGIAAEKGGVIGANDYDRWVSCFRDGMDLSGTGFESMVFAIGTDSEGNRHFERFSGQAFQAPVPAPHAVPVMANVEISAVPFKRGSLRKTEVDSSLRFRAEGGPVQYLGLSMPVSGEPVDWQLRALKLADGRDLAWVGLTDGIAGANIPRKMRVSESDEMSAEEAFASEESSEITIDAGLGGGGSSNDSGNVEDSASSSKFDADSVDRAEADRRLVPGALRWYQILVVLPEPVAEGEEVEIQLDWSARWQFANWTAEKLMLGPSTGPQPFLPDLFPLSGGTAWNYQVEVGIPSGGLRPTAVALSGDTEEDWVDESAWILTRASGEDELRPAVALGRWYTLLNPASDDSPAVRVHLFSNTAQYLPQFGPEVRRVVAYLDRFLPAFPVDEVDVYQGSSVLVSEARDSGFRRTHPGMVGVERVKVTSVGSASAAESEDPHMAQTMVARQVAHQYWGQHIAPASGRDVWIGAALSDAYAAFYVRSAFGNEAYEARMSGLRGAIEDPTEYRSNQDTLNRARRPLSLTGATRFTDVSSKLRADYGAYLAADMIRLRIGDFAYFYALDRLARQIGTVPGSRLSTDDLQAAFEASSGQDLSDFFDYWVHGGFLPEIQVRVSRLEGSESGLLGCVETNIPFGRMDIPVEIVDQGGERRVAAMVDVIDGEGAFWVPERTEDAVVELDPLGFNLAYERDVKWEKSPSCDRPDNAAAEIPDAQPELEEVIEPEEGIGSVTE
jgi:hypothetical protein